MKKSLVEKLYYHHEDNSGKKLWNGQKERGRITFIVAAYCFSWEILFAIFFLSSIIQFAFIDFLIFQKVYPLELPYHPQWRI